MKILKFIAVLILALVGLAVLGLFLPRPTPPPPGKMIELASGVHINTYQKGEGETIVLIHGLPGSADDWPELVDALVARGFHVVWYDRVGYGHSSRRAADAPHTMQVNGQELDQLIDAMGLGHPALVGWSFGGGTVQASEAARHADTPFVVLMAAVAPAMKLDNKPENPPGAEIMMRMPLFGTVITKAIASTRFNDNVPERWMDNLRSVLLMKGSLDTMDTELEQVQPSSLDPSDILTPTLVIHGRKDKLIPYDVGVDLASRLPNGKLLILEESGHMLPMTYPDTIADAIKDFANESAKNHAQAQ